MRGVLAVVLAALAAGAVADRFPTVQTMQEKISLLRPVPMCVVYLQRSQVDTLETIRAQFATIKSLGFTCLKQLILSNTFAVNVSAANAYTAEVYNAALDEGLIPWWYGEAGWEPLTDAQLAAWGIDAATTPLPQIVENATVQAWQVAQLRARIANMANAPSLPGPPFPLPGRASATQPSYMDGAFASWLSARYGGNVTALQAAWQYPWRGLSVTEFTTFAEAAALTDNSTNELLCPWAWCDEGFSDDYTRYRDALRFQTDFRLSFLASVVDGTLAFSPHEPIRSGENMLLDNMAQNGWSLYDHGQLAYRAGGWYTSMHPSWHLSLANGELDFPVVLLERLTRDSAPLGWAGEFESSGGPTRYDGGQDFGVSAGQLRRFWFTYFAHGMRGIGVWAWNPTDRGDGAGDYSLTSLSARPNARAVAGGAVAKAVNALRYELWSAEDEPVVGILSSWETEAMLARNGMMGPPLACVVSDCAGYRTNEIWDHSRSRMGVARALYDSNVPFRFVFEEQVLHGLVVADSNSSSRTVLNATAFLNQFPVLFAAGVTVTDPAVLAALTAYVAAGGRLVVDWPFSLFQNYTINLVAAGSPQGAQLQSLFGCVVDDFSNTRSSPAGLSLAFTGPDNNPYTLQVLANDSNTFATDYLCAGGQTLPNRTLLSFADPGDGSARQAPALWEARFGLGSVAMLAFEATKLNWDINARNAPLQQLITGAALGTIPGATTRARATSPGWTLEAPITVHAFRRTVPVADPLNGVNQPVDHVFLTNSGSAPADVLYSTNNGLAYTAATDAVSGQSIPLLANNYGFQATIPAGDGLWVRLVRK
jgi:beta-galactosidase